MRVAVTICAVAYVASVWAAASTRDCSGVNGLRPQCRPVEALHHREVFHVGGHYDEKSALVDKLYVEKLTPSKRVSKPYPLVFFHGGGYSGAVSPKRTYLCGNPQRADMTVGHRLGCRPLIIVEDSRRIFSERAIKSIFWIRPL